MTDRYERIRAALAMGPTPGPWEVVGLAGYGGPYALRMPHRSGCTWYGVEGIKRREDAEYFVACDPDTILALLDERDALAAEVERLAEALRKLEGRDKALLRQALEALEQIARDLPWELTGLQSDTITLLRDRLEVKDMEQKV